MTQIRTKLLITFGALVALTGCANYFNKNKLVIPDGSNRIAINKVNSKKADFIPSHLPVVMTGEFSIDEVSNNSSSIEFNVEPTNSDVAMISNSVKFTPLLLLTKRSSLVVPINQNLLSQIADFAEKGYLINITGLSVANTEYKRIRGAIARAQSVKNSMVKHGISPLIIKIEIPKSYPDASKNAGAEVSFTELTHSS